MIQRGVRPCRCTPVRTSRQAPCDRSFARLGNHENRLRLGVSGTYPRGQPPFTELPSIEPATQADFGEMLRFILHEGDWNDWSGIASCIADVLPRQEAFELLSEALESTPIEHSANLVQAISTQVTPPQLP